MKIIFVIPHMAKGGAERVVSLISTEMAKDHEVTIVTFHGPIEYKLDLPIINLNLRNESFYDKIINLFRRTRELKKVFKQIKPDRIYSFIGNVQPILTGFPIIPSIRIDLDYSDEFHNHRTSHYLLKTIYKLPNVKAIVAVSKGIKTKLENRYQLKNVSYIHNPINFDIINHNLTENSPIDANYIVAVGSFKSQNAFDLLIKAYSLSKSKSKLKLVIVGDGSKRNEIEELIKSLNLEDKIILTGKQSNPYKYLQHAEMFVLSSLYEGFPNVLIEALACGAACIATDCETGPNEIITNGENGLLIPVNDIHALTNNIDLLFEDQELKTKFRKNSKKSIEHLEISSIARKWLTI